MLGSAALAAAYLQTRTVPDIPGSSSGSGMSRNLETLVGAFYFASGLQVLALLVFAAAMIPSRKRLQTALFSLPMVVYVVAVLLLTGR